MSEAALHTPYSAEYLSLLARKGKLSAKKVNDVWYTTGPVLDQYMRRQMVRAQMTNGQIPNDQSSQNDKFNHSEHSLGISHSILDIPPAPLKHIRSYKDDHEEYQSRLAKENPHHAIETALERVIDKKLSRKPLIERFGTQNVMSGITKKALALGVVSVVVLTFFPVPFVFSFFEKSLDAVMGVINDANTVMGFRPGTHANELLLLDKEGNIAIVGHIESRAEDGIAPIVVDSKTLVKNLNAEYIGGASSTDFTLAFVTKNGAVTTEDVTLSGNVEIGETLLVRGAAKLLASLEVGGGVKVLGNAEFGKILRVLGPAYFEATVQMMSSLEVEGSLNVAGSAVISRGLDADVGYFNTLGVGGDFSASGEITLGNATSTSFFTDRLRATVGTITSLVADDFSVSALTATNSTTTNSTSTSMFSSTLVAGNATTTNFFSTQGTFGTLNVTGDTTVAGDFTVSGDTTTIGQLLSTRVPTLAHVFAPSWPSGTSNASDATIYINPATAGADANIFAAAVGGAVKFLVDAEGDVYANNLVLSGSTSLGETTVAGNLVVQDSTSLGDAPSDTTTVNSQLLTLASTTLQNFTFRNATGTSATTTNFFATIASSTNLYATSLNVGNGTLGGLTMNGNVLASAGSLNIGSSGTRFGTIYADAIDATSLTGTVVSGSTSANDWTINSDNATADTENMTLAFERGSLTPNALLTWNFTSDRFEFNSDLFVGSGIGNGTLLVNGSTTLQNFTFVNATGTNATTTNIFSTTASSTNLFSTSGNIGTLTAGPITSGLINGQTISNVANFAGTVAIATSATIAGSAVYTAGNDPLDTIAEWQTLCTNCADIVNDTTGTLTVGRGGTGATTLTGILQGNGTSAFTAITTSAGISGQLSDEQGSGALVFATSPTLTTPNIGAATGSSLNVGAGTVTAGTFSGNLSGQFNNSSIYSSPTNSNTLNSGYSSNSDDSDIWINYRGYADGQTVFRDFRIGDGKGTEMAFFDGSTHISRFTSGVSYSAINTGFASAHGYSTGNWGVRLGATGSAGVIQAAQDTTAYPLSLNPYGGSVGIGTTAPNSKFEVATDPGNSYLDGVVIGQVNGDNSNSIQSYIDGGVTGGGWAGRTTYNGGLANLLYIQKDAGDLILGNAARGVSVTGTLTAGSFTGPGTGLTGTASSLNIGGNAGTATTLQTARTINGVSFNGSANIAVPSLYDTNYRRITNPGGAEYVTSASSVTGAIAITMPTWAAGMFKMKIEVYEYGASESFTLEVGGHLSDITWYNEFAYITANQSVDRRFNIRFGRTGGGLPVIYIGELGSTWDYPQVYVTEFQHGYSANALSFTTGWSIGFEASAFAGVTRTQSNVQIGYAVSTNTANSVVLRDASGNFSAGTITASGAIVDGGSSTNWASLDIGGTNSINAGGNIYSYSRICAGAASGDCTGGGGVILSNTGTIVAVGSITGSSFSGSGSGLTSLPVSITTAANATWGGQLTLGGNGGGSGVAAIAKIQATDGNLHLDPGTGKTTYINYYAGSGVNFGNGASGVVASVSSAGLVTGSSFSGAGTGLTGTAASLTVGAATTATTAGTANAVSFNDGLTTSSSPTFVQIYSNGGWFRNYNRLGLYNETQTTHLYADSAAYWRMSTNNGLMFNQSTTYDSVAAGYVYHDTSNFGLLNNQGNWLLYAPYNSQAVTFPGAVTATSFSGSGTGLTGTAASFTAGFISGQGTLATASAVTDAQVPNNITIDLATSATSATTAGVANDLSCTNCIGATEISDGAGSGLVADTLQGYVPSDFAGAFTGTNVDSCDIGDYANGVLWNCVSLSDERLKTNVTSLTVGGSVMDKINQIDGITFEFNETYHELFPLASSTEEEIGFIAQDVQRFFPQVVKEQSNGYYTLVYSKMVPIVWEGLKELYTRVISIEERLTAIEYSASSTPSEISTTTPGFVASVFESIKATVVDGVTNFASLVVDNLSAYALTVGKADKPAGITIYDEDTGEPFCAKVKNGAMVTVAGTCAENAQTDPSTDSGSSVTMSPATTFTPIEIIEPVASTTDSTSSPQAEPVVESVPEPAPAPEPVPEPASEPAAEPVVESTPPDGNGTE